MNYENRIKITDEEGYFSLKVGKTEIPYITKYSVEASDRFTRKVHIDLEVPIEEIKIDINL